MCKISTKPHNFGLKTQIAIVNNLYSYSMKLITKQKESENDLRDLKENIITNIVEYETY